MRKKLTTKDFITLANIKHNNKYDYSKTHYVNSITKVTIICSIHGEFEQRANNHLHGIGCSKCRSDKLQKQFKSNNDIFVEKAKMYHGEFYDYSLVKYDGTHTKVTIICPIHGEFNQSPANHYRYGCNRCNGLSKGELKIENWLKDNKINFISQHRFKECKTKRQLPFDFYLPDHNTCIEFDGEHHFTIPRRSKNKDTNMNQFKQTKINDKIKDEYCLKNNIRLIRIPYFDIDKINDRMDTILV